MSNNNTIGLVQKKMSNNIQNRKCAVTGCLNRKKSGIPMYCIPRNPDLNRKWLAFLGRPTNRTVLTLFICKDHFASTEFGVRGEKLPVAVPTYVTKLQQIKAETSLQCQIFSSKENIETMPIINAIYSNDKSTQTPMKIQAVKPVQTTSPKKAHKFTQTQQDLTTMSKEQDELFVSHITIKHLTKLNNNLLKENQEMCAYKLALEKLFTKDQIINLLDRSTKSHWSEQTKHDSLLLLQNIGLKGYQFLISRGFPLPAVRTLHRSIKDLKASPDV